MIKDENYYTIHGWMRNRLGLKGNELTIYAILYGFSQDGESEFRGRIEYISELSGAHKDTVRMTLKNLKEKGFVRKVERNSKTGETNGWICVPLEEIRGHGIFTPPLRNLHTGGTEFSHPGHGNPAPIINLNKESYKEFNIEVSKKESKNLNINKNLQSYDELLDDFGVFGEYREAMFRFIGHLKVNHEVVMLNNRLQDLIIKLDMRYSKDYEKASVLDDAIAHNYKFLECETA